MFPGTIPMDSSPVSGSTKPVTSGGVYDFLAVQTESFTPKFYENRVNFTNNGSYKYQIGNLVRLHYDVTVNSSNVTIGYFAIDITEFSPKSYNTCVYFMSGYAGIGLTDNVSITGQVWLKTYDGNEFPCTAMVGKRLRAEVEFFV